MTTITRWVLRILGAATLAGTAAIHLHLYRTGYKHIPKIGHMFIALVISAAIVAVIVLVVPRALVGLAALAGALLQASTAIGLIIFTNHTIFQFRESTSAPYYTKSLVVESIGLVVLGILAVTNLKRQNPDQ